MLQIECYIYAEVDGGWAQENDDDAENAISCTVLWFSKLQI